MTSNLHPVRNLSRVEMDAIPPSIRAGMDVDAIEIHKRKWTLLTPTSYSVVRGNKIFYPNDPGPAEGSIRDIGHLAHLVHEAVHVWQYENLGIGVYAPQWLDRRYRYDLNAGDVFQSFGLEQQAAIAEDSFRAQNGLGLRWAKNNPAFELLRETVKNCNVVPGTASGWV